MARRRAMLSALQAQAREANHDLVDIILRKMVMMGLQQGPTGTRYPTQTRSFFQYPIRTRFVFIIIVYFRYRVFQKTIFLTWKTLSRSYKILTNIIFI